MRTVTYKVDDLKKVAIHIGRAEENEATRVQIDAGSVFAEYPAAVPAMKVISPAGVTYSREVTRDGDMVVWDVVDSDLAAEGYGEMQLTFTENSVKVKSAIAQIRVCRSISGGTTPPDPVQDWLDEAEAALDAFPTGGTTGQVLAKKSNDDYDTEWVDQGAGGVSDYDDLENRPQIGGVTLTGDKSLHDLGAAAESDIPDVSGFYTKPAGGIPASDIADGVIPDPEDLIDDTAGEGDTDKTWSADKLTSDVLSALNVLEPSASASDVGKMLKVKTVADGKVTEYEFGEGGGSVDPSVVEQKVDEWCDANITNPSNPPLDKSLTLENAAAPAYVVGKKFPISPIETSFFEDFNYGVPQNVEYVPGYYADNDGKITASTNAKSLIFNCEPNTTYYMFIPSRDRDIFVESDGDFVLGQTYTKLTVNTSYISYNGGSVRKFTTGATAKKVWTYFRSGTYDYEANKNNIIITKGDFFPDIIPSIKENALNNVLAKKTQPAETAFFDGGNLFVPALATFFKGRYVDAGKIKADGSTNSVMFPVEPNTVYWFYVPNINRGFVVENTTNEFNVGSTFTQLAGSYPIGTPITFKTGATAKYVLIYFKGSDSNYDWDANKGSVVLNKDVYVGASVIPHVAGKYLENGGTLNDAKILIFGDSITSCCNLTINGNDETTAYEWRDPSNTYTDGGGNTVNYSMWAKILKESQFCGEIRNYAYPGAEYKTATRPSGDERMNLHYQIDVAMNDLDNPHNVFTVAKYVPDIVIFALGTNDGNPNDTYDSAMQKTVLKTDGYSIDVDATVANLDETKFCESARKAFMRIKSAFPVAQIYVVLPLQTASNDTNLGNIHSYLKQMAERYGAIIVDGTMNSGITRDFNIKDSLGVYLKDGLHPNEKGQNLLARLIISTLKANYMPFGYGFNP